MSCIKSWAEDQLSDFKEYNRLCLSRKISPLTKDCFDYLINWKKHFEELRKE